MTSHQIRALKLGLAVASLVLAYVTFKQGDDNE